MNRKNKIIGILLGVVVLIIAVVGISVLTSSSESEEAGRDDELILAFPTTSEPDTGFDPTLGWGNYGGALFQNSLFKYDSDMEIEADLATDYSVSNDGLTWEVELREDVLFSDGTPFTAEDVVYTFMTAANNGTVIDLNILNQVEAVEEHKVVFDLKQPNSTFLSYLVSLAIVPEHAHGEDYQENPIGTGPYELVQWNKGQQMIVEANENYYGKQPHFRRLTILWLNSDTAHAAAEEGELDLFYIPANLADNDVEGMERIVLDSVDNRGISYVMVPDEGEMTEAGVKIGNDVTSDINIRQAIDIAIDRDLLIEGILNGYGTKATSVSDNMPWWNDELAEIIDNDSDMEQAKAILDSAGWVDENEDGVRKKDGVEAKFDLIYLTDDQLRQALAVSVKDMLEPLGIEVTPVGMTWDETGQAMHSSPSVMGWGSYNPLEIYNLYHSDNQGVGWVNTGFYSNEIVDNYIDQAMTATSQEEANEFWQKAHWDGDTGFSSLGDVTWSWLLNVDHIYLMREGLDIGTQKPQPHAHGFPILDNVTEWEWE